jgi:hypothetical protein
MVTNEHELNVWRLNADQIVTYPIVPKAIGSWFRQKSLKRDGNKWHDITFIAVGFSRRLNDLKVGL